MAESKGGSRGAGKMPGRDITPETLSEPLLNGQDGRHLASEDSQGEAFDQHTALYPNPKTQRRTLLQNDVSHSRAFATQDHADGGEYPGILAASLPLVTSIDGDPDTTPGGNGSESTQGRKRKGRRLSRSESSGARSNRFAPVKSRQLARQQSSWKFKYDQYMADQPALDDSSFGAGKREFYRRQREMLEGFRQVDAIMAAQALTEEEERQLARTERGERLAVQLSNLANIILLVAKIFAAVWSGSLAVIASALDSLLDIMAGGILWWTSHTMQLHQPDKYPIGKKRMQPVGIIIFAAIMATLGLQVCLEGIKQLLQHSTSSSTLTSSQLAWVGGILGAVIAIKAALFAFCRLFDNDIVRAYALDHFFDVITNVTGLVAVLLAASSARAWWLDPAGAIVIALYTTTNWGKTVLDNAVSLVGSAAPPDFIGKITYLVFNHHAGIKRIDTVRAWTYGNLFLVEARADTPSPPPPPPPPHTHVDIELPEDMPLSEAHDIGEMLQNKIEALPEVERAYVHLDYWRSQRREHTGSLSLPPSEPPPLGSRADLQIRIDAPSQLSSRE
eukprot:jgi/Mesen1/3697/ME000202S02784